MVEHFRLKQDLGVAKLQIYGTGADIRFPQVAGFEPPPERQQRAHGPLVCSWLAPGEWMVTGPEAEIAAWVAKIERQDDDEVLAVDLTHGRVSFLLAGPDCRSALAAHCPLDLSPESFRVGEVARSLFGDAGIFIARTGEDVFRIVADQTMAAYIGRLLRLER